MSVNDILDANPLGMFGGGIKLLYVIPQGMDLS